jgi:Fe-S cluster biogenesis protein NfuA
MSNKKLEELLDELVRPGLREHGGDVALIGLNDDGVLRLRMLGKCAGCPGATLTNETLIEGQLMPIIPGLKEVVLVHDVSNELLDMARQLMQHHAGRSAK